VAAAKGHATVYRSLRSPGRFLVLPRRYAVGRFEPTDAQRAYRPMLLLHSTIDIDDPTGIRCALVGSLQPDVPPYMRAAILAELRRTAHPDPALEWLPAAGVEPTVDWALPADCELDAVVTADGLDVVVSTDVPGFLALKGLLERDAVRGTVTADLPGGVRLAAELVLGVGAVVGPFGAGPVELGVNRGGRLQATNRSGQRLALTAIAAEGETVATVGEVLAPGAGTELDVPHNGTRFDAVYALEGGQEQLDEVRAYVEDLRLGILFVATGDFAASGSVGLQVRTRFLGRDDLEPLVLTATAREAERSYVLPLTGFAADPAVDFQVTSVAADGTRRDGPWTSWPVRTRGALVPVSAPKP